MKITKCSKCGDIITRKKIFPVMTCDGCKLQKQRKDRAKSNNQWTHKYEKTPNGFLMRLYRNMESRILGIQKQKAHLYKGKYLLDRDTFYKWAKSQPTFYILFEMWEQFGYDRKLTPTVDRIDSSKGYELSNMEWVTHSENSRRGSVHANELRKLKI